jgi:Protein of unknown function (DUF3500)
MISRFLFIALLCSTLPVSLRAHVAANEMAAAASSFLNSLDAKQKGTAYFEFKDDERLDWHFIPKSRKGLPIKEMTPKQRKLAHALLASGLSRHGYEKATNIMSLERILYDMEGSARKFPRDGELYYFSLFGTPAAKGTWGWRVEGHHFSANFTIVNGEFLAGTPSFLGTNPGEVRSGPRKGLRVLAEEEDLGRQLVKALKPEQAKKAIFTETAPKEIVTEAKRKIEPLEQVGIAAADLDKSQSGLLLHLVETYVQRLRPDLAAEDLAAIQKAGFGKVYFGWAGGTEKGQPHYYRVQGPTFLLEYDNTQNDANHIHAAWRDFQGDFGEDLLRKHYEQVPHQ